jgi:hypothetical protein
MEQATYRVVLEHVDLSCQHKGEPVRSPKVAYHVLEVNEGADRQSCSLAARVPHLLVDSSDLNVTVLNGIPSLVRNVLLAL